MSTVHKAINIKTCIYCCAYLHRAADLLYFWIILRNLQSLKTLPISCTKNAKIESIYYETENANF